MQIKEQNYDLIQFKDGEFSLDVTVSPTEDTVWLSINNISKLFNRDISVIGKHIRNILKAGELDKNSVWAKFAYTAKDNKTYFIDYYNLDMIISVGYRVNSKRGILFRKWATSVLKQYLLKGFLINEKRCLECQENLVSLNNKMNSLAEQTNKNTLTIQKLKEPHILFSDKLFYEDQIFNAYSFIKQLFHSTKTSIILIDGYVDITVLDLLVDILLPITIYTYPSSLLTNQDIDKFNLKHTLTIVKTSKIHDRFILIDDKIYLCGASIKDVGKKRFVLTQIDFISISSLLNNLK